MANNEATLNSTLYLTMEGGADSAETEVLLSYSSLGAFFARHSQAEKDGNIENNIPLAGTREA